MKSNQSKVAEPIKQSRGRPSKLDTIKFEKLAQLYAAGLTDAQLAEVFDVSTVTINNWKHDSQFFNVLKNKGIADNKVVESLWKSANGYDYEEKTFERKNIVQEKLMDTLKDIEKT